jgi:hypothetical protein
MLLRRQLATVSDGTRFVSLLFGGTPIPFAPGAETDLATPDLTMSSSLAVDMLAQKHAPQRREVVRALLS